MQRSIWRVLTAVVAASVMVLVTQPLPASAATYRYTKLQNGNSRLFAVVGGASTAPGAALIQFAWEPGEIRNDEIVMEIEPNGYMRLKPRHMYTADGNPHNDQCLAVRGASRDDGAQVIQHTCTYDPVNNDVWVERANGGGPGYVNQHSQRCLVVAGASRSPGALLIQWECNGTPNGHWFRSDL